MRACAVALLEACVMPRIRISEQAVRQGLEQVSWPGRLERLRRHPEILCDGAHNPAAADCLKIHLQARLSKEQGVSFHPDGRDDAGQESFRIFEGVGPRWPTW